MENHEHQHMHDSGIPHTHIHENQKAVLNRLSRAIGHLEKVKGWYKPGRIAPMCLFSWQLCGLPYTIS